MKSKISSRKTNWKEILFHTIGAIVLFIYLYNTLLKLPEDIGGLTFYIFGLIIIGVFLFVYRVAYMFFLGDKQ